MNTIVLPRISLFLDFFNIYPFFERERVRETERSGGGPDRKGDAESEAGHRL